MKKYITALIMITCHYPIANEAYEIVENLAWGGSIHKVDNSDTMTTAALLRILVLNFILFMLLEDVLGIYQSTTRKADQDLRKENDKLKEKIEQMTLEKDRQEESAKQKVDKDLWEENEQMTLETEKLKEKIEQMKLEREQMKLERAKQKADKDLREENEKLKEKIEQMTLETEKLKEKIEQMKLETEQMKLETDRQEESAKQKAVKDLWEENEKLKEKIEQMKLETEKLKKIIEQMKLERDRQEESAKQKADKDLREEIEQMKLETEQMKLETDRQEESAKQKADKDLQEENEKLKEKIEQMKLETDRQEESATRKVDRDLREENEQMKLEIEKMKEEIGKLQKEIDERKALFLIGWQKTSLYPDWRKEFFQAANVILDPDTAHTNLSMEQERRCVTWKETPEELPDNPQRFYSLPCVLGQQFFTSGRFYWEVDVTASGAWDIGICRDNVMRKGRVVIKPENGFWAIRFYKNEYWALSSPETKLTPKVQPSSVCIFMDYEDGCISFYNMKDKTHIHTFHRCSFYGSLRSLFRLWSNDSGHLKIVSTVENHTN